MGSFLYGVFLVVGVFLPVQDDGVNKHTHTQAHKQCIKINKIQERTVPLSMASHRRQKVTVRRRQVICPHIMRGLKISFEKKEAKKKGKHICCRNDEIYDIRKNSHIQNKCVYMDIYIYIFNMCISRNASCSQLSFLCGKFAILYICIYQRKKIKIFG